MFLKTCLSVILALVMVITSCTAEGVQPNFDGVDDPNLPEYIEDEMYAELEDKLEGEGYIIENIQAVYISEEYLDELAFNSQMNVYFGFTQAELEERFKDEKYVFTLGTNNETIVEPWVAYDDTFDRVVRNVAIGTGVILICVTVSVATAGVGLTTTSLIFAASAKTGATVALSSGIMSGVAAGVIEGTKSGDLDKAVKAAALQGSESFKWGAITGAITGGLSEFNKIRTASRAIDNAVLYEKGTVDIPGDASKWRQAELRALDEYGGYEQLTYLDGKQVAFGTPNGTRPDVIRYLGDHIEAVEVKYYNLDNPSCVKTLYNELEREISSRVLNLPNGSTQRIVLDVTDRAFSSETIKSVTDGIGKILMDVYPNIPIDVVGWAA